MSLLHLPAGGLLLRNAVNVAGVEDDLAGAHADDLRMRAFETIIHIVGTRSSSARSVETLVVNVNVYSYTQRMHMHYSRLVSNEP